MRLEAWLFRGRALNQGGALNLNRPALALALLSLVVLASILAPHESQAYWSGEEAWSPSFLLLSNWVNDSVLVYTGVPIANATFNGLRNLPLSITNVYLGPYGLLPLNLTFDGPYSDEAYLTLNNTVLSEGPFGYIEVMTPPQTPYILVMADLSSPYNMTVTFTGAASVINGHVAELKIYGPNYTLTVFACSNTSLTQIAKGVVAEGVKGPFYVVLSLGSPCPADVGQLVTLNDERVDQWLSRSRAPVGVPSNIAEDYFLSLLVLKDDQNPYLGTFAASPSPLYLYTWVRDSSFAAMALQAAGHYGSALKYWAWMAHASRYGEAWYTRYNFYTGAPDESYAVPEYDSLGLFEIGVYYYYVFTKNVTFLDYVAPALNETVAFQVSSVLSSSVHLIPEDLSIWEYRTAYHFWTEAVNLIGMYYAEQALSTAGYNITELKEAFYELNQSIQRYFWNGSAFYTAMVPSLLFTSSGKVVVPQAEAPYVSSSSVLPLALGHGLWPVKEASSDVQVVLRGLWSPKVGGLIRFYGDTYHYDNSLYDSSGPNPPWTLTTLFLAYYYAVNGNKTAAEQLLSWALSHSQHGLLPEAVDPNYGNPLPTTSPLTWSCAMYVLTVLALSRTGSGNGYLAVGVGVIVAVLVITYVLQRAGARRVRQLERLGPS